jgi:MYXO-CTERM domain-containing protein
MAKTLADDNPHFTQVGLLRGTDPFTDEPEIVIDNALEGDSLEDVQGVPTASDGGAGAAGTAGTTSGGGGSSSGGSGGSATGGSGGATSDAGVGGSKAKPSESEDDGSCGCAVPGARSIPASAWLLALVALGVVARRRP